MALTLLMIVVALGGVARASAQTPPVVLCQNYYTQSVRVIHFGQQCLGHEARIELQTSAGAAEDEAALQQQIDDLAARVAALEGRMDTAEGDIDSLQGRTDTLEDDIDAVEGRMDSTEGDVDSLEGRMDTAEMDIDVVEGRVDTAVGDIITLDGRIDTAESDIDTLDTRVTNIRNFFTDVADAINACFTEDDAVFSITIPAIEFPAFETDLFGLLEDPVVLIPAFTLFPETTIGFPVFNADEIVPCLDDILASTGL